MEARVRGFEWRTEPNFLLLTKFFSAVCYFFLILAKPKAPLQFSAETKRLASINGHFYFFITMQLIEVFKNFEEKLWSECTPFTFITGFSLKNKVVLRV